MADLGLVAPWTPEQVTRLNDFQRKRVMHPFTCANRGEGHAPINSEQDVLVATVRGWVCPFCDYTQNWAHHFMTEDIEQDPALSMWWRCRCHDDLISECPNKDLIREALGG